MTRAATRMRWPGPELEPAQQTWLRQRAARVRARVDAAPGPWAAWAREQLDVGGAGWDAVEGGGAEPGVAEWDRLRDRTLRATLGQVFTPPELARLLAVTLSPIDPSPEARVLDPACGAGSLLVAVCEAMRARGVPVAEALSRVEGWDRDPIAAWLCRARLVTWALDHAGAGGPPGPLAVQGGVDALDPTGPGAAGARFAAVVANPPYLEAKRMGSAEPGLRERLVARFPRLERAFDLYLAFVWLALEVLAPGGEAALLLPNKVCQGRYARGLREALLGDAEPALVRLIDLSQMHPRPFPGTSVYPVVLHVARRAPAHAIQVRRIRRADELSANPWDQVRRSELRAVGGEVPLFVPFPETWPDLAPLLSLPRLGDVAELASTCSFHARGLRERFVGSARDEGPVHPYLGLHSRARQTEVTPFRVRWAGGWIRYDQDALRGEHRNPLPDLERTFLRPKVIWCQHALRMRPFADLEGRWVTKDTYPVAWPTAPEWTVERLTAVFASTVFTALHNTLYQGVRVGGETYHYLPAFLRHVPVPDGDHPALADVDRLVRDLQSGEGPIDTAAWLALDRAVATAYGVDEAARDRMARVHLARVGAELPGSG